MGAEGCVERAVGDEALHARFVQEVDQTGLVQNARQIEDGQ